MCYDYSAVALKGNEVGKEGKCRRCLFAIVNIDYSVNISTCSIRTRAVQNTMWSRLRVCVCVLGCMATLPLKNTTFALLLVYYSVYSKLRLLVLLSHINGPTDGCDIVFECSIIE